MLYEKKERKTEKLHLFLKINIVRRERFYIAYTDTVHLVFLAELFLKT